MDTQRGINKREIIDKLKTIIRNVGKSSIIDKYHIEELIIEIENTDEK